MKVLSIVLACIVFSSFCNAENILLSAATTNKELVLVNIESANKKYTIVDSAIFTVPTQVGVTALGRLQNGNFQVIWTAVDASNKIKLNQMIVDPNLNQVGNTKKIGPVLSSYANLNIVGTPSLESFEVARNTFVRATNRITGNLQGPSQKLFTTPNGVRLIDTAFSYNPPNIYYSSLGYAEGTQQYVAFFGNTSNTQYTSAFVFDGDVLSIDLVPEPGTDDYYFTFVELFNKKYSIKSRRFDGPTGLPSGSLTIQVSNITGDLGQLPFFNMVDVAQHAILQKKVAFFTDLSEDGDGTDIRAYQTDAATGKRTSPILNLNFDFLRSPRYFYALDAVNMTETVCLQDDNIPAQNVVVDVNSGVFQVQCNGNTYTGTGRVTRTGVTTIVEYNSGGSRLSLSINLSTNRGTASFQTPQGTTCTIVDSNINNNSCN